MNRTRRSIVRCRRGVRFPSPMYLSTNVKVAVPSWRSCRCDGVGRRLQERAFCAGERSRLHTYESESVAVRRFAPWILRSGASCRTRQVQGHSLNPHRQRGLRKAHTSSIQARRLLSWRTRSLSRMALSPKWSEMAETHSRPRLCRLNHFLDLAARPSAARSSGVSAQAAKLRSKPWPKWCCTWSSRRDSSLQMRSAASKDDRTAAQGRSANTRSSIDSASFHLATVMPA